MKLDWRMELPQLIILVGMFVVAAMSWSTAPDRIPVHWNAAGDIDRYGGRFEGILLMPLIALGLYLLLAFIPRIDPGRANYAQFQGAYAVIRVVLMLLLAVVYGIMHVSMRGVNVDMGLLLPLLMGGMLIALGGVLGKIRPNWFVGIRTPWTLSSKTSWARTHRVGGWAFMIAGVLVLVGGLVSTEAAVWTLLGSMLPLVVGLFVYSYVVWRDADDKQAPAGTRPAEAPPDGK